MMNNKSLLFLFLSFINPFNAMDQQNDALPLIPKDVLENCIIPIMPEEIVKRETTSVKNARCDLYNFSRINKKTYELVNSKLKSDEFTDFFVETLAQKKLIKKKKRIKKLAIAAHLGTEPSMRWIGKYLKINGHSWCTSKLQEELISTNIQVDSIRNCKCLLNARKLLFHLTGAVTKRLIYLIHQPDPWIKFCSPPYYLRKLKSDNTISYKILSLLMHIDNDSTSAQDSYGRTALICSLIGHRTDLSPLFFNEKLLNHQDKNGCTALMYAMKATLDDTENKQDSLQAFHFMLSKNPDLRLKNKEQQTALGIALSHPNKPTPRGQYIIQKLMELEKIQDNTTQKKNNER